MKMLHKNPKDIFNKLNLGAASTNLQNNKKFIEWLQYVNEFRAAKGVNEFPDQQIFDLLRWTKHSKDDLIDLFQSLSRVHGMKDLANSLQLKMFRSANQAERNYMNTVWLKALETPDEVFTTLRLADDALEKNSNLIQWLKFSETYRGQVGKSEYSRLDELNLLMKSTHKQESQFGTLFLALKEEKGMEKIAQHLQSQLFKKWLKTDKLTPDKLGQEIASVGSGKWELVFKLSFTDPKIKLLESYTVAYAAQRGDDVLTTVNKLFKENKPIEALNAAIKA